MEQTSPKPSYCISDAHLGAPIQNCEQREEVLHSFLRMLHAKAANLFIMGDLFDFWIEYRHAIRPDYVATLCELSRLRESGVTIHYIAGNHDFALGPFLEQHMGIRLHRDAWQTELFGKKLYLYHGDGLIKADWGYRLLKKVLRNRWNQRLYRLLHPDIAIPLAGVFSGGSRSLLGLRIEESILDEYRECARQKLAEGFDGVIFGHTHRVECTRFGEKTYANTGEWIRRYNFLKIDTDGISAWQFVPGRPPRPVQTREANAGRS